MQQALQNPHFKKIWEKINWQIRHPEAKSLEEALIQEAYNNQDCVYIDSKNKIAEHNSVCVDYDEDEMYPILHIMYNSYGGQNQWCATNLFTSKNTLRAKLIKKHILGRPITLEDILIITKKHEFRKCDIDGKSQIRFFKTQTDLKYLGFDWQLTKPLHEQTPETWEKISNLID